MLELDGAVVAPLELFVIVSVLSPSLQFGKRLGGAPAKNENLADGVQQQVGVGRVVDVGLDHRGIAASAQHSLWRDAKFFMGQSHDDPIDPSQGISADAGEVVVDRTQFVALRHVEGAVPQHLP